MTSTWNRNTNMQPSTALHCRSGHTVTESLSLKAAELSSPDPLVVGAPFHVNANACMRTLRVAAPLSSAARRQGRQAACSAADDRMSADDEERQQRPVRGDAQSRAQRKEAKRSAKAERKEARVAPLEASYKPCGLCSGAHPLLIRCKIDASGAWYMVCGKCWKTVSGGVTDGDSAHPHYVYGGLWKAKK
jgi:hypothetical protein